MLAECLYGGCLGMTVSNITVVEMESLPQNHTDVSVLILKSSQLQSCHMDLNLSGDRFI